MSTQRQFLTISTPLVLLAALCSLCAQTAPKAGGNRSQEFDLKGDLQWVDTGFDLHPGETLKIAAAGTLTYPQSIVINRLFEKYRVRE